MVARWKHAGLPLGCRQRRESVLKVGDWPGAREEEIQHSPFFDGRPVSQFLVFGRPADSVHTSDSVGRPSGTTVRGWRRANPLSEQQRQRDERADLYRWKMGGVCLR